LSSEKLGIVVHESREDSVHPRLVDSLALCNVDIVACGEFHTCAVTTAGELYTWGAGTHDIGLLFFFFEESGGAKPLQLIY
jgi:alpha-tubulin suppressor-like RCC1 family protein